MKKVKLFAAGALIAAAACDPSTAPTLPDPAAPAPTPGSPAAPAAPAPGAALMGSIRSDTPRPASTQGWMETEIAVVLTAAGPGGIVPVAGRLVSFVVTSGTGALSAHQVATDADGVASTTLTYPLDEENAVVASADPNVRITSTVLSTIRQP
jgi:hypothetical protein